MKRFSKLLAVVLAIAVIICPMMSVVSHATTNNGYKIEAIDANTVQLTINSTDGFVAYHATVGFNSNTAFQSSYNADGYVDGLKVNSYTLKTAQANDHNAPTIRANASGTSLNVIVMPSDTNNLDLCTEIVIRIRVASGATATLTKIQAADNGTVDSEDANLLTFPAANESTGEIDQTAEYATENATTVHTHDLTLHPAVPATCTTAGNSAYYTCSGCDKIFSDSQGTTEIQDATIPALGHNMTHHDSVSSTCKVQGNIEYYSCSRCGKFFADENGATELTEEGTKRALAAHTPRAAVVENNIPATCTTAGSYDSVVYCAVCGDEISRNHVDVQTTEHTPGKPVIENSLASTCTEGGHYDTVVYCTECGAEISRETTNLEPNGHTVVNDAAVAATCTETGLTAGSHCSVCDTVLVAQTVVPALGHAYTYHENGDGTHAVGCERCDYSAQETCDTNGTDGVCSKCGYKAAPAEPVLDTSLASTLYSKTVQITSKVGTFFTVYLAGIDYDAFEFVVSKPELPSPSYTYTGSTVDTVFNLTNYDSNSVPSYHLYQYSYSNIGLYEMGSAITCTLYIIKDESRVSYYTWETFTLADLVKAYYDKNTSNADNAGLAVAILNLGTAAQIHFGAQATKAGYTDNTLALMPALNETVDQSLAPDYGELSTFATVKDPQVYNVSIQLLAAPSLRYTIYDSAMTATCKDPTNVTLQASYTSGVLGSVVTTVSGAELPADDRANAAYGMYTYSFSNVALYDTDKVVTFTFSGTDETTYSCQLTLMTLIAAHVGDAGTAGAVYNALATLAVAASNKFN